MIMDTSHFYKSLLIYYITGGARSGKSSYAMQLARKFSQKPLYIATARRWDEEFEQRIQLHKRDRDEHWVLVEEETKPSRVNLKGEVAILDCVTLWLTNLFVDHKEDVEASLTFFKNEMDLLKTIDTTLIIISNEIGMGLHAETSVGRKFTDLQGWANQYVAELADNVIFMVSGLPTTLK